MMFRQVSGEEKTKPLKIAKTVSTHHHSRTCVLLLYIIPTERPSKVAKQNHANVSSEPVTIPDSASVVVVDSTAAASKESRADGSGIDNALILPDAVGDKLSVVLPATQQQTTVTLSVVSPEAVPLPLSMRDEAAGSDTSVDVLVSVCDL